MASTAVHIKDMLEAINDGRVPGAWSEDHTSFVFPTVVSTNARGAKLLWTITVRLLKGSKYQKIEDEFLSQPVATLGSLYKAEITVEAKQEDGKVRDHVPTYVPKGKNIGKANATNAITQALRDALGKYNKQSRRSDTVASLDRVEAEEAAGEEEAEAKAKPISTATTDGRPPPMLVKKLGDSREATLTKTDFERGITVQPKLNGVRDVSFEEGKSNPRVFMYSRGKNEYLGMNHVRAELLPILALAPVVTAGKFGVPERFAKAYARATVYIDGEIFKKGKPLQWISGQARKEADEKNLDYYVFDCFFPGPKAAGHDMESKHRQEYLDALFAAAAAAGLKHPHIVRVPNYKASSEVEMFKLAKDFVKDGYEGAIARKDWVGYRYSHNNYHSGHLVKIKPRFDDEFPVVGFTEGTKGKDKGAIIWICEVPKDKAVDPSDVEFNAVPNMTYEDRYRLFKCLSQEVDDPKNAGHKTTRFERDIKGLPLTVEYAELSTKTGKPLQPKGGKLRGIAFRTYPEGFGGDDPIKRVFADCGVEE